jgi:calcineurin-like phosphoesterase family protein
MNPGFYEVYIENESEEPAIQSLAIEVAENSRLPVIIHHHAHEEKCTEKCEQATPSPEVEPQPVSEDEVPYFSTRDA